MLLVGEGAVRSGTTTRAGLGEGLAGLFDLLALAAFFGSGLLTGGLILALADEEISGLVCGAGAGTDAGAGAKTGELATTLGLDGAGAILPGTIAFAGFDGGVGLTDGVELLRIGVNICLGDLLMPVFGGVEPLLPGIIVVT